ncbi:MAG: pantoate--beta-alanine ligase, partial [Bacillota bacterium]
MKIVNTIQEVRECVKAWRTEGLSVGFVPTMGYLHEGHQSLIHRASIENDRVVVSIFINPLQFGKNEDLDHYPRDLKRDSNICAAAGTNLMFHPDPDEMYGKDFCSFVDMNGLTETLCGKSRPNHFRGVCTVVLKLFNIVKPDRAYFGQKDAQQIAVIKRMVEDLNIDVEIVPCRTVRESDGLAKSSRNIYLNKEERRASSILQEALQIAENKLTSGIRTTA